MNSELKQIKKLYGEKFSHLCRELFSTILEHDGLLLEILTENFAPNHFLYVDLKKANKIESFKNYIYNIYHDKLNKLEILKQEKIKNSPEELMDKAGYILKECTTEDEIQSYRKYYSCGEELCTFRNHRLDSCRVFFAVKKNVLDIKREDFKTPRRQDEYGTSVISIQFTKDGTNTLSIKNRYNHKVENPDATFSNDLDNIVAGLTESFENTYGIIQKYKYGNFEIPHYARANDGRLYKYNYEINNIYYCSNNIIIDNFEIKKFDKEKYIILDYFVLDLMNKKIYLYDKYENDSFIDSLSDICKINILNEDANKRIILTPQTGENIEIVINNHNQIIGYRNNNLKEIENRFMAENVTLNQFVANKLEKIGDSFLFNNEILEGINCPNLKEIGNEFLYYNRLLEYIYCPNLEKIENNFLAFNKNLKNLNLLNLKEIGNKFLYYNEILESINCPNLLTIGNCFLYFNKCLDVLELPNLQTLSYDFMFYNNSLKKFYAPNLEMISSDLLSYNKVLEEIECPKVNGRIAYHAMNSVVIRVFLESQKVLKK